MLLWAKGKHVCPEEIEDKMNSMTMGSERVIIEGGNELVGLAYPEMQEAKEMDCSTADLGNIMEQNRIELHDALPSFCRRSAIELRDEEFAKTPKKSIKHYLYQEVQNQ